MSVEEIKEHLKDIRQNIARACKKSGRDPEEVKIVVLTRNHKVPELRELIDAGINVFGENRVQEAVQKKSFFEEEVEWHLVGHLQSVKARAAVKTFHLIHSVDGLRIGYDLQKACDKLKKDANILIHADTTGGESQFGVLPSEAIPLIKELIQFPSIRIRGLMTEPPLLEEPEESRPYYKKLKELQQTIREADIEGVEMKWLVMGSSFDYEIAVEEGSNLVKIYEPIFSDER